MLQRQRHASEALECIERAQRWMELTELIELTELMELMELMEPAVNTKYQRQSKQSELVRTCLDRMVLVWGYFCCM
jgi:hypothetical protein